MNLNRDLTNVPIELLRTFVVSIESSTVAEAERRLNLTRDAIAADIKSLERIVGCVLLLGPERRLSKSGGTILSYAQRLVSANDELMRLMARTTPVRRLRIGMPIWLPHRCLIDVIKNCSSAYQRESVNFRCDELETLMQDLNSGRLDLVFSCNTTWTSGTAAVQWTEPLYWIKSRELPLRSDVPVSLVSWPGCMSDRVSTTLLDDAGLEYSIMFSGRPVAARITAVAAGLGLMLANERLITPEVRVAREDHLPAPPLVKSGIYMREGLDTDRYGPVLRVLAASLAPRGLPPAYA